MNICFVNTGFTDFKYTKIQEEYVKVFYNIRLSKLKFQDKTNIKKLSDVYKQKLNFLFLSGQIKKQGKYTTTYFDTTNTKLSEIKKANIFGFSSFSCNYKKTLFIAKKIKTKYSESIFIIGGPHASALPKEVLKTKIFDIVVKGNGELALVKIIQAIEKNKSLNKISNISYLYKNKIIENPIQGDNNTDLFPFPDYSLLNEKRFYSARIFTSRGCPFNCAFCANKQGAIFYRNFDDIKKEIDILYNKYGTRLFYIGDENFVNNIERATKIIYLLENTYKDIKWIFQTRLSYLPQKIISLLKNAKNLVEIDVGIENFDDKILKINNKHLSSKKIIESLKKLKTTKKMILGYWIIGLPGEIKNTLKYNLDMMKTMIKQDLLTLIEFGCFVPYPGTQIFANPKKYGIKIKFYNYSKYTSEYSPVFSITGGPTNKDLYKHYNKTLIELMKLYKLKYPKESTYLGNMKVFDCGLF
jgi:anaerobic magnesium-protoporphyrin IX monomethyl ester cyclase